MIRVRRAEERGHFDHGWLNTLPHVLVRRLPRPDAMGFRALRVINEDRVAARPRLRHARPSRHGDHLVRARRRARARDSMGTGSVIRPGDVQRMSAGTGVSTASSTRRRASPCTSSRSGFCRSGTASRRRTNRSISRVENAANQLRLVASPDGRDGSVDDPSRRRSLQTTLRDGSVTFDFRPNRYGWLQVARGAVTMNGEELRAGDGAAIEKESQVTIAGDGEALLFDLNYLKLFSR